MVFNATQETKYNKFTCELHIGPSYEVNTMTQMDLVKLNVNDEIITNEYWSTGTKRPFIAISDPNVKII